MLTIIGLVTPAVSQAAADTISASDMRLAVETALATNVVRAEVGLDTLILDPSLFLLAYQKAIAMAARGEYGHVISDGVTLDTLLDRQAVSYYAAGENLAFGYESAEAVTAGWLESPVHAANIKNSHYTHLGVAALPMVKDGVTGYVFVQIVVGKD